VRRGVGAHERTWDVGGSGGATKRTDGRCRFDDINGRRRFMEGRTRGGSLPLRALIGSIDYKFYYFGFLLSFLNIIYTYTKNCLFNSSNINILRINCKLLN
jgi:hypothetical protein